MNERVHKIHEDEAARAFSEQSSVFDKLYASNTIVQYKRQRVRAHIEQHMSPGSHILELNAGTGEDAIYFASQGHRVHASDISGAMLGKLVNKAKDHKLQNKITSEICSFTDLQHLKDKGPYDIIFSNFAGLNCTPALNQVLQSMPGLLKNGGIVTLVIMPKFCLWETMLMFKGKFKTAFRRFFSSKGVSAHIEGHYFLCWYYNPSYILNYIRDNFELLGIEGLCTIVPPSYIELFAEKYPRMYRFLTKKEGQLKNKWPWKQIGDYYIISFKKTR